MHLLTHDRVIARTDVTALLLPFNELTCTMIIYTGYLLEQELIPVVREMCQLYGYHIYLIYFGNKPL